MRRIPLLPCLLVLAALTAAARPAPAQRAAPPNILFVMADDLGWRELGCYGQEKIRTPEVDRLAREGIRFTQAYSGAPVCAPARCVLLTGLHSGHAFVRDNREVRPEGQHPIPAATITLAERLKERGYVTAAVGKWGLGGPGTEGDPNRQGFDLFYGYNCQRHAHNHYPTYLRRNQEREELAGNDGTATGARYSHDLMEAEALRFLDQRGKEPEKPFFLYVPFAVPHLAIQVPEDSLAEYRGKWEDPPYTGGKGYLPHPTPRAAYAAMVTRLDRSLGRLRERLERLGLARNTLVVFTSDNGPTYDRLGGSDSAFFQSAGALRGFKGSVYEGGIRVPFVAAWPGRIPAGRTSDLPIHFADVVPTLTAVAGAPAPARTDGVNLLPVLTAAGPAPERECLYWEFPGYGGQQAARFGRWKAVRQGMHRGPLRTELYDLEADPNETRDLAGEQPETVARAERLFRSQREPSAEFPFKALDGQ
jgi:arylsulfatase A